MSEIAGSEFVGREVGQYRIVEFVGRGGMGRVYRGRDTKLKRDVAIKMLPAAKAADPVARARFVREARMASRVVHPYVATLFDVAEAGDDLFLIMEYIRGRTLAATLDERPLSHKQTLAIAEEMVEALGAIHRAGLVHRDLKPSNVMITEDGHVKVMDFGVASAARILSSTGDATSDTTLTRDDHGGGTVVYMSPEQLRGDEVDARSDLFALGDVLYESITGRHPFARGSAHETVSAILNGPPGGGTEPDTLTGSDPLRPVVMRLLEKKPADRYASAEAVLEVLRAIRGGRPVSVSPSGALRVSIATAVIVLAAVTFWLIDRRPGTPRVSAGGGRPGVLVLPFEGATADPSDTPRGAMMASFLRADLAGVPGVRVVGSTRTDDLLALSRTASRRGGTGGGLATLAAVRYLVSGRYASDGAQMRLAIDVYDAEAPDRPTAFVVEGGSIVSLLSSLDRELRKGLSLEAPGGAAALGAFGSTSDAALLSAERGRRAAYHGDYETAGREYGNAVLDDPEFVRAHLERARVLYDAGFVFRARESVDAAEGVVAKRSVALPEPLSLRLAAVRAQVDEKREDELAVWKKIAAGAPDDPDALVELSDALQRANLYAEALTAVDKASAGRPLDASILLRKAKLLRLAGKPAEAASALEAARRAGPAAPTGRWAAALLIEKADQLRAASLFPEARASYEDARTLLAAAGEPLILAAVNRGIGEAFLREGKPAEAVAYLRSASDTLRAAGSLRTEAVVLDALGATLFQLSRYPEAEAVLRQAIRQFQSTEGLTPKPNSFLNLASVLTYTGRCDEATEVASQAGAIAKAQGDAKRSATAELLRAAALACEGKLVGAVASYESTIEIVGKTGTDERVGWALGGIAELRALGGEITTALQSADRSVAVHRETKQRLNVAYALVGRARIRRFAGDVAGATTDIAEARVSGGGADLPPDLVARIALDSGIAALDAGDLASAEKGFRTAVAAPTAIDLSGFARAGLAETLCRDGRAQDGLAEAKAAAGPPSTFAERLEASHALATCLLAAGENEDAATEARRSLGLARAAGARWPIVLATVDLTKASPKGSTGAISSGRQALQELMGSAPGRDTGSFAHRAVVRDAWKMLGPS